MTLQIKRVSSKKHYQEYSDKFCKHLNYRIPIDYFKKGKTYCLFNNNYIIGGFTIVETKPLRVFDQIPKNTLLRHIEFGLDTGKCAEITGYWISKKAPMKGALALTIKLVSEVFLSRSKYFFYSWLSSETALGRYYGYGNPNFVWKGVPNRIEGHTNDMEEEIFEYLTKWGVAKIFIRRTLREVRKNYGRVYSKRR